MTGALRTFLPRRAVEPQPAIWEDAYRRFESEEQEIAKFIKRLRKLGALDWPRTARLAELFCGRGNGLRALCRLGFRDVVGLDASRTLVALYDGPAEAIVGDCRALPWPDRSRDIVIAQGGLHHLQELPSDLERVLSEVRRVLAPAGRFIAVEPWLTPFLQLAHLVAFSPLRHVSDRLDAFATMAAHEQLTYERWLSSPELVRSLLERHFHPERLSISLGKLYFVGTAK